MSRDGRTLLLLGCLTAGLAGCSHLDTGGFPPLAAATRHDADTRLNMARLHERQGQLGKAREQYYEVWTQDRTNAVACHRLGVVSSRLGQHDQAMQFFAEARRLDPQNSAILTDMGYALYVQNNFPAAEQHLRQAIEMNPQDQRATNNLALVVGHQGRTDESLALFRRAVSEAEANANVAYIHLQRGEGKEAAERYSRSLSLDSQLKESSHALVQIAELQQGTGGRPQNAEPNHLHVADAAPLAKPQAAAPASPIQLVSAEQDVSAIVGNNQNPPDDLPPGESIATVRAEPNRLAPPSARPAMPAQPAIPAQPAMPAVPAGTRFPIPVRTAPAAAVNSARPAAPTRMQATAAFTTSVQGPNGMAPQIRPRSDLNLTSTVVTNPYAQPSEFETGAVQTGAIQSAAPRIAPGPVITPGPVRPLARPAAARQPQQPAYGIQINPGPRASPPPVR